MHRSFPQPALAYQCSGRYRTPKTLGGVFSGSYRASAAPNKQQQIAFPLTNRFLELYVDKHNVVTTIRHEAECNVHDIIIRNTVVCHGCIFVSTEHAEWWNDLINMLQGKNKKKNNQFLQRQNSQSCSCSQFVWTVQ